MAKSPIDWDQVAIRLSALRADSGLTQLEVASRAGLQPGQVSKHENGLARFDLDTAAKYSDLYGVPIDYVVFGRVDSKPKSGETLRPPSAVLDYVKRYGDFMEPIDRDALLGMRWPVTPDEGVVRSVHAVLLEKRKKSADPDSGVGPKR